MVPAQGSVGTSTRRVLASAVLALTGSILLGVGQLGLARWIGLWNEMSSYQDVVCQVAWWVGSSVVLAVAAATSLLGRGATRGSRMVLPVLAALGATPAIVTAAVPAPVNGENAGWAAALGALGGAVLSTAVLVRPALRWSLVAWFGWVWACAAVVPPITGLGGQVTVRPDLFVTATGAVAGYSLYAGGSGPEITGIAVIAAQPALAAVLGRLAARRGLPFRQAVTGAIIGPVLMATVTATAHLSVIVSEPAECARIRSGECASPVLAVLVVMQAVVVLVSILAGAAGARAGGRRPPGGSSGTPIAAHGDPGPGQADTGPEAL